MSATRCDKAFTERDGTDACDVLSISSPGATVADSASFAHAQSRARTGCAGPKAAPR
jgi:hypothetical protein